MALGMSCKAATSLEWRAVTGGVNYMGDTIATIQDLTVSSCARQNMEAVTHKDELPFPRMMNHGSKCTDPGAQDLYTWKFRDLTRNSL
eukprot:1407862-Prymnesium_polylepis.1